MAGARRTVPFLSLFLGGLVLRAIVLSPFYLQNPGKAFPSPLGTPHFALYHQALSEHFWEFLWYAHSLLPLYFMRSGLEHALLAPEHFFLNNLVLLSVLGSLSGGFVYAALANLRVPPALAILAAIAYSARLIIWDGYIPPDAAYGPNPFLFSVLAWSLTLFVRDAGASGTAILAGLIGALAVFNFQQASLSAVPMLLVAIVLLSKKTERFRQLVLALTLPVLLTSFLVFKNTVQHGIFAPSTSAGTNIIQNLSLAVVDPRKTEILSFAKTLEYPKWWVWCYEEAGRTGVFSDPIVAGSYGTCHMTKGLGYDYRRLKAHLIATDEQAILKIVQKDEQILAHKPWLYAGGIASKKSRFSVAYGKVAARLLPDIVLRLPWNYGVRTYTNLKYFVLGGSAFPLGQTTVKERMPAYFRGAMGALSPLFLVFFVCTFLAAIVLPVAALGSFLGRVSALSPEMLVTGALAIGVGIGSLASVGFHCCDNDRHAFNYFPIFCLVGTVFLYRAYTLLRTPRTGATRDRGHGKER